MAKKRGRPFSRSQAEAKAIKEIQSEYYKLKARINRIEEKFGALHYGENNKGSAVEQFYERGLQDFSVKGKGLEELNKMRLDIEYISTLRTSYVKGTENYMKYVNEWVDLYDKDKDAYNKIFTLYNRLVEENELAEKFKYQIVEEIYYMEDNMGHLTDEQKYLRIKEIFKNLYHNTRIEDLIGGNGYEVGGKVHKY